MIQLWTIANLQRLEYSIRKKVVFYAPLTESLDFFGVDPCTYTRAGTTTAAYRGGSKTVAANVPPFNFTGDTLNGLYLASPATLQFDAANNLNNANTVVWFENRAPKSTPTQTNPFDAGGNWTGNLSVSISHITKANAVLANSEITAIQAALLDTVQDIPAPPAPPENPVGAFVMETPAGSGTVFTLSQNPDLTTLIVAWAGLFLKRVGAAPAELQYTATGSGNKTITLGSTVIAGQDLTCQYVVSA